MSIENEVREGWHDAIIEMFEIDLSTMLEGPGGSYFFTKEILPDGSKVQWKGQVYEPFPIEANGFERTSKGQIPQPELTVANVLGTLASVINSANDLVGAKVIRRRTLFKYLDNGSSPSSSQEFPEDEFYIERKAQETNISITWQLSSKIDLEGLQLPKRIITQNHCLWRYRGAECGYAGPPVANAFDGPLSGGSAASQAYLDAVAAFNRAEADLQTARDRLANTQGIKDVVCDIDIIKKGEETFNLRRASADVEDDSTRYAFYLEDRGSYFAAYEDNVLVPRGEFNFEFGKEEVGNSIPGEKQNTGREPGGEGNGTGPIYAVNRWVAVIETPPVDPEAPPDTPAPAPVLTDIVLAETVYDPPNTFSFFDLDNFPIIAVNGTLRTLGDVKLLTPPGEKPSLDQWDTTPAIQTEAWVMGPKQNSGVFPVRSIQRYEYDTSQCDDATTAYDDAVARLDEAQSAYDAALAALQAAIAALPDDDELYAQDQCGKRLSSCRLRFPLSPLPFGAFPGANLPR